MKVFSRSKLATACLAVAIFCSTTWAFASPQRAFIYNGPGSIKESVEGLLKEFKEFLSCDFLVEKFDTFETLLKQVSNHEDLSLWVMPGGESSLYERAFHDCKAEVRESLIRMFNQGKLAVYGVSDGAYFFSKGYKGSIVDGETASYNESEECGPLGLFPHVSLALDSFHHSPKGALYVPLYIYGSLNAGFGGKYPALWNGGPAMTQEPGYVAIAYYEGRDSIAKMAIQAREIPDINGKKCTSAISGIFSDNHEESRNNDKSDNPIRLLFEKLHLPLRF